MYARGPMAASGQLSSGYAGNRSCPSGARGLLQAEKGGGSMKITVNLTEEQRQFIEGLLSDTQQQFADAFRDMANDKSAKSRRKFVGHWISLTELTARKHIEKGGKL